MDNTTVSKIANVQAEMMFVGCIYKNPQLILEVEKVIKSDIYFSDVVTKFFYDCSLILYKRDQSFTEKSITIFMSEDGERLTTFREVGGYNTIKQWIEWASLEDFNSYYEMIKKFSLLREYELKLDNLSDKMKNHKSFQTSTANDIYFHIRSIVDKVHTNVLSQVETEYITQGMQSLVDGYLETPSMGAVTPFLPFNSLFRGFRTSTHFSTGMISNAGKTRLLVRLAAHNAMIQGNKTLLLLNEMSAEEVKNALLVTVINNDEFRELHRIDLVKPEQEIVLGMYRHTETGVFVERKKDDKGNPLETSEEYISRLMVESREYREMCFVNQWIEENGRDNLAVIDIASQYDDRSLETQIRKNARLGYRYIFYDTMKSDKDDIGNWAGLKTSATLLTEVAKSEDIFLYSSIQLTDETENIAALDLNSNQIANAKQIRHVLDSLVLAKEIEPKDYGKYLYHPCNPGFGEEPKNAIPLPESGNPADKLYAFVVSKNRAGEKKKILVQVNLDYNSWNSIGYIVKK
jgi:hypothetical protein